MFKLISQKGKIVADNVPSMNIAKRMASALGNVYVADEKGGIISGHTLEDYYKKVIGDLVVAGATVQFGNKLSICCFNDYFENNIARVRGTLYQVDYNDRDEKKQFSKFYQDVWEAVDKFVDLELKYGKQS